MAGKREFENECLDCGHIWVEDMPQDACPECHQVFIKHRLFLECCGELVECRDFTNTCEVCGADYSMEGHRLAPRQYWGEETGETASDVLVGHVRVETGLFGQSLASCSGLRGEQQELFDLPVALDPRDPRDAAILRERRETQLEPEAQGMLAFGFSR